MSDHESADHVEDAEAKPERPPEHADVERHEERGAQRDLSLRAEQVLPALRHPAATGCDDEVGAVIDARLRAGADVIDDPLEGRHSHARILYEDLARGLNFGEEFVAVGAGGPSIWRGRGGNAREARAAFHEQ